jgi:alpha-L-fucosidase
MTPTIHIQTPDGPFEPTWESLMRYQVPDWYQDAKFGIFIHWGVYCVPAFSSEWYPRNMYRQGSKEYEHHVATYGPHTEFGYKDFIPQFTAEKFDAAAWAMLFKESGAKYVVPVAEHHDGFPMYDCSFTEWNAAKMGPKRDIVGELATAVRAEGLTFGVSSHRAENWWFFDGGKAFPSDVQDAKNAGLYGHAALEGTMPSEAHMDDWLARTCELVDKYRPNIVWFDWWIEQPVFRPYLRRFAAYYYNRAAEWGEGVAINYKNDAFPKSAAVYDIERGQLADTLPYFWQTDTSVMKNSWCYIANPEYRTAASLIHDLCDIVSKNGCLLLNIGPKADGTIPDGDAALLHAMGRWLAVSGEAIYDTRPWKVYGEGPTEVVGGSFNDTKRSDFTARDVRFTVNGDTLYAILLGWPEDGQAVIRSLGSTLRLRNKPVQSVTLLGASDPLTWTQEEDALRVSLPASPPSDHAVALKII